MTYNGTTLDPFEWLSLHLFNSVNCDKIEQQHGHSVSDKRYIPEWRGEKEISITISGLVSILEMDIYPDTVMEMHLTLLPLVMYLAFGNQF